MTYITRFAPSPTGPLHLGHAYSALTAHDRAQARGGRFLLRIDDADAARCTPEWEAQIEDDLRWLGLDWPEPVRRVSQNAPAYTAALAQLAALGLVFPCACTRRDVRAALDAPQEGAPVGPDGIVYPGTCRHRSFDSRRDGDALRLDMTKTVAFLGDVGRFSFEETGPIHRGLHRLDPDHLRDGVGDVVLARREGNAAYHLSVVVDDAAQEVSEAVRGADLFEATAIHRLLQALLDLPSPAYHHHALIRDENGKRLAKRSDAMALARFRGQGVTPAQIRAMVGLPAT